MMKIDYIAPSKITPYENNAKLHPDDQIDAIANSIKEFGWQQPIVIDKDNVVIIGHGRLLAAKKLKLKQVPVVMAEELTDDQIKALRLADNKTNESAWDFDLLDFELDSIDIDMEQFGFDLSDDNDNDFEIADDPDINDNDKTRSSLEHNVFENQEQMQFETNNYYGFPEMKATQTTGNKFIRFCDWKECEDPQEYIAHFYYDDYKFINAWREPDKYIERLKQFKAVVSPDFSLYTDFPIALQILSCYRRQWCGAYWQMLGIDVIPDVVWGEKESFNFCFDGIPKHSTVAVSSVGVKLDKEWNNVKNSLFLDGYNEMMNRLEPTAILFYGDLIEGLEGNIIKIPSFYAEKREMLNEMAKKKKDK